MNHDNNQQIDINFDRQSYLVKTYKKLFQRKTKEELRIYFLRNCQKSDVTPNFIQRNTKLGLVNNITNKVRLKTYKIWLDLEIKDAFIKRNYTYDELRAIHLELTYLLHPIEWDILEDKVRTRAFEFSIKKRSNLNKKLNKLKTEKTFSDKQDSSHENLYEVNATFLNDEGEFSTQGGWYTPIGRSYDDTDEEKKSGSQTDDTLYITASENWDESTSNSEISNSRGLELASNHETLINILESSPTSCTQPHNVGNNSNFDNFTNDLDLNNIQNNFDTLMIDCNVEEGIYSNLPSPCLTDEAENRENIPVSAPNGFYNMNYNINSIFNSKVENVHNFHPRTLNLSNTNFSEDEMYLLNKGLKFSPPKKLNNSVIKTLAVDTEFIIEKAKLPNGDFLRAKCGEIIRKHNNLSRSKESNISMFASIKSINNKIKNDNLVISKADKGTCVVILNRPHYNLKVEKFLNENKFKKVNSTYINKFDREFKGIIRQYQNAGIYNKYQVTSMNPQVPKLYGLPKIHKGADFPIRPVVSYIGSHTHKLAKFLDRRLKDLLGNSCEYTINNTTEFINKIKNLSLPPEYKMVSFDVTNLFTSVPVKDCLNIIKNKLINSNASDEEVIAIVDLLECCLKQDFFQFDNVIYKQEDGLAMGNPLSPWLADIFMNDLESKFLELQVDCVRDIVYWGRYVDDIFCLVKCNENNESKVNDILNLLNSQNDNIKFTSESEIDKSLNFLDLTIKRTNQGLQFSIFRKPTNTDHCIDYFSDHPTAHKLAFFNSMLHRLFIIPLHYNDFKKEVQVILQIAKNNNYPVDLVRTIFYKKLNKIKNFGVHHLTQEIEKKQFYALNYYGGISRELKGVFKNNNVNISFSNKHNLNSIFVKTKDKTNNLHKNGVYCLTCKCGAEYVGQTGRRFIDRINEHLACLRKNSDKSNFASHINTLNHDYDKDNFFKILHVQNKGTKLNIYECLEIIMSIKRKNDNNLNDRIKFDGYNFIKNLPIS